MSYKSQLIELRDADEAEERDNRSGVTAAIVEIFEAAITDGRAGPGAKLPPTRQLAELTGVNHLTAARAYRQLAERGLVSSKVGSGTFVRAAAAAIPGSARVKDSIAWQRYVLPEFEETYGDRVLAEMHSPRPDRGADPAVGRLPVGADLPDRRHAAPPPRGDARRSPSARFSTRTSAARPSSPSRSRRSRPLAARKRTSRTS